MIEIFVLILVGVIGPSVAATHQITVGGPRIYANASATNNTPVLESSSDDFILKFRARKKLFYLSVIHAGHNETTVWTANRDRPVSEGAGFLADRSGKLVLVDTDGTTVWNVSKAVRLHLTETGNLVASGVRGEVVWQSFDHPTDILLPNQTMRAGTFLVSAVSETSDSTSIFMGGVLPGGAGFFAMAPRFFAYGIREFNTLQKAAREAFISMYNSTCNQTIVVFSADGLSLEYRQEGTVSAECLKESAYSAGFYITINSTARAGFRYIKMEPDGNLKLYLKTAQDTSVEKDFFQDFWTDLCRLPNRCGPYGICKNPGAVCECPIGEFFRNSTNPIGCRPKRPVNCSSNGVSHGFVQVTGVDYFPSRYLEPLQVSADECKARCLANCSCAVAFYWWSSGSCFHYEELLSMRSVSDQTQVGFLKVALQTSPEESNPRSSHFWQKPGNIIGVAAGGCLLVGLVLWFAWPKLPKKSNKTANEDVFLKGLPVLPPRFTYTELKTVTQGFTHKLGEGGFGAVFFGTLPDGFQIAVKRIEEAPQGHAEFRAEIAVMASLNHLNLVRLRGFCVEETHRLLVYDFMVNGSLERWLFGNDILSWEKRVQVAVDTSRGLAFLHEECRECIIHADIKPENILLDREFRAKISDFGLSRLLDRDQSRIITAMRGTPGYLAPEWIRQSGVSSKSDVYSLGVVILEMVAGRRCIDLTTESSECFLPALASRRIREGTVREIVDERIRAEASDTEVNKVVMVGLWCVQVAPSARPKASTVCKMLEGRLDVPDPPKISHRSHDGGAFVSVGAEDGE